MNKVVLFDADVIPYVVCHNKKDEPEKSLDDCIQLAKLYVTGVLIRSEADYYSGFLTEGKESFRYKIYPDYKGQRTGEVPKYFKEVKQFLRDEYGFVSSKQYEADDLILIVEKELKAKDYQIVIISADKDIINTAGSRINPNREEEFNIVDDQFADEYFWKSMIIGDSADNIKGIPGKGVKFANQLFEECELVKGAETQIGLFRNEILYLYIDKFGEYKGIEEFYKNYKCLKILNENIFNEQIEYKLNKFELIQYV